MKISVPTNALVIVADGTKATFYRNKTSSGIKLELWEVVASNSAKTQNIATLPVETSPNEKNEANFAAKLAHDIHVRIMDHEVTSIVIVADPQTLGQLRACFHSEVVKIITGELAKTMTNASITEIEKTLNTAIAGSF